VWAGMVPSVAAGVELEAIVVGPPAGKGAPGLPIFVGVHPYGKMGGSMDLMLGPAVRLAAQGITTVVMNLRGVGRSSGWCSLTQINEIDDVRGVCRWLRAGAAAGGGGAMAEFDGTVCLRDDDGKPKLAMFGSSAGSCVAGSAMDEAGVVAGVFTGYTFGWWASILFGGHFEAIKSSELPKCFIQGSDDGFTSAEQLRDVSAKAAGLSELVFVDGVGHFELESPEWDDRVADIAAEFVARALGAGLDDGDDSE